MKHVYWYGVALIVCMLVLPFIPTEKERNTADGAASVILDQTNSPGTDASASGTLLDRRFNEQIVRLFLGQINDSGSWEIVSFQQQDLPKTSQTYALHGESAYVIMEVAPRTGETGESFLDQIKINGGVVSGTKWKKVNSGHLELSIKIHEIKDRLDLHIPDLPRLSIKRMIPLQVTIDSTHQDQAVLAAENYDPFTYLYVSDQLERLRLHFSEPMINQDQIGASLPEVAGTWINQTTYDIDMRHLAADKPINLASMYALSGNYLPQSYQNVEVRKIPQRAWVEYPSGKKLAYGTYRSFYDALVFSPDQSKYVGVIRLAPSQGDGNGSYYTFILEQPGQPPRIIEHSFYTDVAYDGLPILWINEQQLAFGNYKQVFLYDIAKEKTTVLYDSSAAPQHAWVKELAYDPYTRKLYALTIYNGDDPQEEAVQIDRWTFDVDANVSLREAGIASVSPLNPYYWSLPIHVRKHGIYWTFARMNQIVTQVEGRKGDRIEATGLAVLVTADGHAVLRHQSGRYPGANDQIYWWEKGKNPVLIPTGKGQLQPFGTFLLARDAEGTYRYVPQSNTWTKLDVADQHTVFPAQENNAYYRRLEP